jgi:eukaryotic-like serine/threonine-protein kinase
MGGSTLPLAPGAFSGRKLGKYEVLCRLSTGGMAEIFLASQRGLAGFRKLVVLKQILPDIKGEEEFVRMFLDEARVTAAFNHPNIAQVFDLDIAEGELFLAMEFVPGATLVEVAKACRAASEPIPIGLSLAAARDTALALHYAHTFTDPLGRPSSVIHRDVAEKNIMVTYEGVTKLLDFGIAKSLARSGRTQIGMVKGTSGYMSPEQILGEPLDARSDLFSLGVVLHECLTGLRLFHAKTPQQGAGAVLHGQVPPPSRTNPEVPPELDAIVLKALSRKREDRYASTLEFARALERAVGPLIWHPEQSAEVIQRLFAERREQTRQLLMADQVTSGEVTGEVRLSQIFSLGSLQQPPQSLAEQGTLPSLPQITAALPSRRDSSSALTLPLARPPQPPPAPAEPQAEPLPEPQARPPPPARGAPTRRPTSTGLPAAAPAEPASVRRAVFEPLPQKRAANMPAPELALPPPPPPEAMSRTRAGEEPARARPPPSGWVDPDETRAAPPEEPTRPEPRKRSLSQPGASTGSQEVARPEPRKRSLSQPGASTDSEEPSQPEPWQRPSRMDLHTMGTLPMAEAPPGLRSPAPDEEESTERSEGAREVQTELRPRSTPGERASSSPSNPGARSQRRRLPTPAPEEEYLEDESITRPVHTLEPEDEEPAYDTNETLLPEGDASLLTSPGLPAVEGARRGWVLAVMALLVLLAGGVTVVIALGLDGGRLVAMIDPPPPTADPNRLDPLPRPGAPAASAPGTAQKTSKPEPAPTPPAPVPTAASDTMARPASLDTAPPLMDEAPSTPASSASEDPSEPPELLAEPVEEESAPVLKKVRTTPKRTRPSQKSLAEGSPEGETASSDERPAATPVAPSGTGQLTLVTEPYAKVYLGRRLLGDTPLFKVSLPSGKHSLRLVDGSGQSRRLPVEIKPGETTAVRIGLDSLTPE